MAKIAVVGSINIDLVVRAPRFALAGETILGQTFQTIPGGKGANQAVAARRMGADVAMIGRVGDDAFGTVLQQQLAAEGITTQYLTITADESTGVAMITVEDNGENCIIVVPGANGRLSVADIEAARPAITEANSLLLQLEVPLATVERAAQIAAASGVIVILNAAPAQPLAPDLLACIDYLVVNETEAQLVATIPDATPEVAARALQALGARNVLVTLGEEGALLVTQAGACIAVPAFAVQAADTTAAGDSCVGAFAVTLANGMLAPEALRWANAAGALAVTRQGAQPSIPTQAEIATFLAAM